MARASAKRTPPGGAGWYGCAVLAWLLLAAPTGTGCEDRPLAPGEVRVSVVAILATEKTDRVDPRVECIAREVRKLHPNLKGFRPAKMTCKAVPVGGAETFELVTDQTAAVTVLKTADKDNRVQLKVTPPTLGEITYTTTCGKFFPIVTRYQTRNGEWLILAVRVQPCPCNKK